MCVCLLVLMYPGGVGSGSSACFSLWCSTIRGLEAQVAKAAIGKAFRKQAQTVIQALEGLDQEDASALSGKLQADGVASLTVDGETFEITSAMVSFEMVEKKEHGACVYVCMF